MVSPQRLRYVTSYTRCSAAYVRDLGMARPQGAIGPEIGVHSRHSLSLGTSTQANSGLGYQKGPLHLPHAFCLSPRGWNQ